MNRSDLKVKGYQDENSEHSHIIGAVQDAYETIRIALAENSGLISLQMNLLDGYKAYFTDDIPTLNGKDSTDFAKADHDHPQYYTKKATVFGALKLVNLMPPTSLATIDVSDPEQHKPIQVGATPLTTLVPKQHLHNYAYWLKYETVTNSILAGGKPSSHFSKKDHSHSEYYHKRETALRTWGIQGKKASDFAQAVHNHDRDYYLVDEIVADAKGLVSKSGNILFGSDFAPHVHDHKQYIDKHTADLKALRRNEPVADSSAIQTDIYYAGITASNGTKIQALAKNTRVKFLPFKFTVGTTLYLPSSADAAGDGIKYDGFTDIYAPDMDFSVPYTAQDISNDFGIPVSPQTQELFSQDMSADVIQKSQIQSMETLSANGWMKGISKPGSGWKCIGLLANASVGTRELSWLMKLWNTILSWGGFVRPENAMILVNPYVWSVQLPNKNYWRIFVQGNANRTTADTSNGKLTPTASLLVDVFGTLIYIPSENVSMPPPPPPPPPDPPPVGVTGWVVESAPFASTIKQGQYYYDYYRYLDTISHTDHPFPYDRPTIAWFVKDIVLPNSPTSSSSIDFTLATDDGCKVFVNGVLIYGTDSEFSAGHLPQKPSLNMVTEATKHGVSSLISLFHQGTNRIAVMVQNGYKGGMGPGAMYAHLSIDGVDYITDGGVADEGTYGQDSSLWNYCYTCGSTIDPNLVPSNWKDPNYQIPLCTKEFSECIKGCD